MSFDCVWFYLLLFEFVCTCVCADCIWGCLMLVGVTWYTLTSFDHVWCVCVHDVWFGLILFMLVFMCLNLFDCVFWFCFVACLCLVNFILCDCRWGCWSLFNCIGFLLCVTVVDYAWCYWSVFACVRVCLTLFECVWWCLVLFYVVWSS